MLNIVKVSEIHPSVEFDVFLLSTYGTRLKLSFRDVPADAHLDLVLFLRKPC
jgi:hypothetical protein